MVDWSTLANVGTATGTLVLGLATFASVRSANRAARTAERTLLAGLRPVLFASRPTDPDEKVMWGDRHFAHVPGGQGVVEIGGDVIYLALNVRNVGSGIAVIHGWYAWPDWLGVDRPAPAVEEFRRQQRDLFVPPGDTTFWQGAIREPDDPQRAELTAAAGERRLMSIDLLYGDLEGGQRTITRFGLTPIPDGRWLASVGRHWHIDRAAPR